MIENTPKHNQKLFREAVKLIYNPETAQLMKKINSSYLYWDKVKYMAPADVDPAVLWQAVKLQRIANAKAVTFGKYKFYFTVTEQMHAMLHEFDMNIGGSLGTDNLIPENDKNFYLVSSVMEEAIASSQMEGASTTRKVAKDMLRKNLKPRDKSQLMIANNYATIRYLSEHRDDEFTVERLLDIHRYISAGTLENKDDEGSIRQTDDIVVMDGITGDIAHTPPPHEEVAQLLEELCTFANNDSPDDFIHPIIKGIILHFMLAYIHPFADGNGRTARSLVYWYMMKKATGSPNTCQYHASLHQQGQIRACFPLHRTRRQRPVVLHPVQPRHDETGLRGTEKLPATQNQRARQHPDVQRRERHKPATGTHTENHHRKRKRNIDRKGSSHTLQHNRSHCKNRPARACKARSDGRNTA